MRYYDLTLIQDGATQPLRHWTSYPNGKFDPAALNIIFDLPVGPHGSPLNDGGYIRLEGIALKDLFQSKNFATTNTQQINFKLLAGMGKGLPLANPAQAGPISAGQVFQCFGNWEGTEMTLDLIVTASPYTIDSPGNLVLNWQAGWTLQQALKQTLTVAFPGVPLTFNISDNLIQSFDEVHACSTLGQLAERILDITRGSFLGAGYPGVQITYQNGVLSVFDSTLKPPAKQLNFTDLVGQPTWIEKNVMQIKLVMRGDLSVGSIIKMPVGPNGQTMPNVPGFVSTTGASMPSSNDYKTTFTGQFQIAFMRHIGALRSANGADWVTILDCIPYSPSTTKTSSVSMD